MLYLNTNYNHHHYRILGRTTKYKGRPQKKKGKKDDIVQKGGRGLGQNPY